MSKDRIDGNLADALIDVVAALMRKVPMSACPRCGEALPDFDGLGVLRHEDCGYCAHAASTGGLCEVCGEEVKLLSQLTDAELNARVDELTAAISEIKAKMTPKERRGRLVLVEADCAHAASEGGVCEICEEDAKS